MRIIWRRRRDREIAEELASHVAMRARANRTAGLDPAAAGQDASRRLGSDLALRERTREAATPRVWLWLEDAARDLNLAARALRHSRGFSLLAIATLALGIGAATAMFSVVHSVLLDPLPFPSPERLVQVAALEPLPGGGLTPVDRVPAPAVSALMYSGVFAGMAVAGALSRQPVYADGYATDAYTMPVSPGLGTTLGVTPELGRTFRDADGAPAQEMIVSDRFWRRTLQGNRAAIGQPLRVGDSWYTLVGVLPPGEQFPLLVDVWLSTDPLAHGAGIVIARLHSDTPLAEARRQAQAALAVIAQRVAPHSGDGGIAGLTLVTPRPPGPHPDACTALWLLLGAGGCLLLIACGNTASLLLARGLGREREFAVRRALGASRRRILRLLLAEGLWLALAGGLGGAALAWLLLRLAPLGPASVPRLAAARLHPAVLAFAAVTALAAGLVCALAPALRLSRPNLQGSVRAPRAARLRWALVVGEVALTLVLLIGGVLLLGSFNRLLHVDLGFRTAHITALTVIAPPAARNADEDALFAQRQRRNRVLLDRLQALPGVEAATATERMPFARAFRYPLRTMSGQLVSGGGITGLAVGPRYVQAMGMRLVAGRELLQADMVPFAAPQMPILINVALARLLWPHAPLSYALGQKLVNPNNPEHSLLLVVGVVGDTRDAPVIADALQPQFYMPMLGKTASPVFLLRSPLPPAALATAARQVLAATDPALSLAAPITLDNALQTALGQPRFQALLLDIFAALALLLALTGLSGALAYQVRQRRREIGVRMALGADSSAVLRLVLGQSLAVLAAGIALGWLLAWFAARTIASLLFHVSAFDPSSWAAATATLLAAGLLASYVPARRALRVDAAEVLRCE